MNSDISVLLVTYGNPGNKAVAENINKIIKILKNFSKTIYLITYADENYISELDHEHIRQIVSRRDGILQFFHIQTATSKNILRLSKDVHFDVILFALGMDLQIIPVFIAKIVGKRVLMRSDGRPSFRLSASEITKIWIFKHLESLSYRMVSLVFTECDFMVSLNKFNDKQCQVGNLFIENSFDMKDEFHSRIYDIGYIGRLEKEKGILEFLESLDYLNVGKKIVICGNGSEKMQTLKKIDGMQKKFEIEYREWVPWQELPNFLNKIKLLVVPSRMEGLPNIILEAMACGTPVLANPVGGIPGIIKNNRTGFLMKNNKPEEIANCINQCLVNPELSTIGTNAHNYIINEFSYESAVVRWKKIIESSVS
jgi:glycosyltransferase involved in cell wall biosynthesis